MFNKKKPEKSQCYANGIIYHGDCSYIMSIKWDDFVADPQKYIEKAYELLNKDYLPRNGYYAFVCEKCAPIFGYYGRFFYNKELSDRAREIYERN